MLDAATISHAWIEYTIKKLLDDPKMVVRHMVAGTEVAFNKDDLPVLQSHLDGRERLRRIKNIPKGYLADAKVELESRLNEPRPPEYEDDWPDDYAGVLVERPGWNGVCFYRSDLPLINELLKEEGKMEKKLQPGHKLYQGKFSGKIRIGLYTGDDIILTVPIGQESLYYQGGAFDAMWANKSDFQEVTDLEREMTTKEKFEFLCDKQKEVGINNPIFILGKIGSSYFIKALNEELEGAGKWWSNADTRKMKSFPKKKVELP